MILIMVLAYYFSDMPADESNETSEGFLGALFFIFGDGTVSLSQALIEFLHLVLRKIAHFTEYAAMAVSAAFGIRGLIGSDCSEDKRKKLLKWLPILISFIYAISDEIHQYFVPGRFGTWYDVLIDTSGAAFGILVMSALIKLIKRRRIRKKM